MTLNKETRILIVGLGLIGGSYARALRKQGYAHVFAITRDQADIDYALNEGLIEAGMTQVEPSFVAQAELVVFALYPHVLTEWLSQYQSYLSPGTVITDVTGVKTAVVYEVQSNLRPDVEFVGAHPMAGREVYGVQNSDEKIFRGANYIVTPTEKNTEEAITLCEQLGRELGFAKVSRLSPEEHDDMIGFLSQLTHCIAVTLMTCNESEGMENYTGDSFRDLTRIARINDAMWSELFMLNRDALLKHMDAFEQEFAKLKQMLTDNDVDGMRAMMRRSTQRRMRFDKKGDGVQ